MQTSSPPTVSRSATFPRDSQGRALVDLFGDLRRHNMGAGLAEEIDEVGTGASVFMTENLWGVGSTPPYLHDGRADTLTEAILEHGGEAQTSRNNFAAAPRPEAEPDRLPEQYGPLQGRGVKPWRSSCR